MKHKDVRSLDIDAILHFPVFTRFGGFRKPHSGCINIINFGAIKKLPIWLSSCPKELIFEIAANFHGIVKSFIEFEFTINRGKHSAIKNMNARSFIDSVTS